MISFWVYRCAPILFFLLPFVSQAQHKFFNHFEIAGGYVFDQDKFSYTYKYGFNLARSYGSGNHYKGFNYLMLGLSGEFKNAVYAVEVETLTFDLMENPESISLLYFEPSFDRKKRAFQLNLYFGKKIVDIKDYEFIAAALINLRYQNEKHTPSSNFGFAVTRRSQIFGLGFKLKNQFKVSENVKFTFGTRIQLFGLGTLQEKRENLFKPLNTQIDSPIYNYEWIRPQFVLQMGLQFRFHKLARTGKQDPRLRNHSGNRLPQDKNEILKPSPNFPIHGKKKKGPKKIKN